MLFICVHVSALVYSTKNENGQCPLQHGRKTNKPIKAKLGITDYVFKFMLNAKFGRDVYR
jgi:hypothetical protein